MKNFDWLTYLGDDWVNERCGLILKGGEVVELKNIHDDPKYNFAISVEDAEPHLDNIQSVWHTHLNGSYNLSINDYRSFLILPSYTHIIVSDKGVASYSINKKHVINETRRTF